MGPFEEPACHWPKYNANNMEVAGRPSFAARRAGNKVPTVAARPDGRRNYFKEPTLNGWLWLTPGDTSYREVQYTPLALLPQGVRPKTLGRFGKISPKNSVCSR